MKERKKTQKYSSERNKASVLHSVSKLKTETAEPTREHPAAWVHVMLTPVNTSVLDAEVSIVPLDM